MELFDRPLVCVDIETDGMNYQRGHILEIAVIRIEQGEIVDEFTTLLNPGIQVPYFITNLTGIRTTDLQGAPTFDDIAERLLAIMEGAIFVAHNVRFDYSFIKQEFYRVGIDFNPHMLCTVKLSRKLHPEERSHKLASLIDRHGFTYSARHRAYDDAHVLYQFLHYAHQAFGAETLRIAAYEQLRLPSLPRHLDRSVIDALPSTHGIYIFHDESDLPIYIGKSVNIRRRVLSHFTRDTKEYKEFKMAQHVRSITYQATAGELSALLLESHLIKTQQPLYNRRLRRQRQFIVIRASTNQTGHITLSLHQLSEIKPEDYSTILAIYPTRAKAKASLLTAVQTFDLCPKLCGLEKASGACFSYQLHKCKGACIDKEPAERYNQRLEAAFADKSIDPWPYTSAVYVSEAIDSESGFIVDQWRIIGTFEQSTDGSLVQAPYEPVFDIDAYKILRAFLSGPDKKLFVRPIDE